MTGKDEYIDHKLNNKATGIYAAFYSLGEILSPNIGSTFYVHIGYRHTCDVLAISALIYALAYFWINVGINIFEKERIHREKLAQLTAPFIGKEHEFEEIKRKRSRLDSIASNFAHPHRGANLHKIHFEKNKVVFRTMEHSTRTSRFNSRP